MQEKRLEEPIEFFKVDKISDDVYALGPNVILRFNVSLSKVANGKRYHFHKEYEYPSRCSDIPTVVTIKRSFDYFLSIENIQKDEKRNKLFIRIGAQEFMIFEKALKTVTTWFTSDEFKYLFAKNKGKLIITNPAPEFTISSLPMQRTITFVPTIIDKGIANDDKEPGVRMYFGSSSDMTSFIDMDLDRFMGLYYIFSCFNMYQSALIMINYLERPELGTNRFVIDPPQQSYNNIQEPKSGADSINGRIVTPKNNMNNISLLGG